MEANFEHVAWTCPHRRFGPSRPSCPLKARLGWPEVGDKDTEVLDHLVKVAELTWVDRYPSKRRVAVDEVSDASEVEEDNE